MAIDNTFKSKLARFTAIIGALFAFLLLPPIFKYLFAMAPLLARETIVLWWFSGGILFLAGLTYLMAKKVSTKIPLFAFCIYMLFSIELIGRASIKLFGESETTTELGKWGNRTYPEFFAYTGHIFLGYTGRPSGDFEEKGAKSLRSFNNMGFIGEDMNPKKDEGVIRVACLGGSTTARGYPQDLQNYLDEQTDSGKFEVLNFGVSAWTSNHSLVNFFLNVQDFDPDYVIIHHAWNEGHVRGAPEGQFRNDYSHAYQSFEYPDFPDKKLTRYSAVYRYFKLVNDQFKPAWANLGETVIKEREIIEDKFSNPKELYAFERNIKTIIEHCQIKGFTPILANMPTTTNPEKMPWSRPGIEQCNAVLNKVPKDYPELIFADLAHIMADTPDSHYLDIAHLTKDGRELKAKILGEILLKDFFQPQDTTVAQP